MAVADFLQKSNLSQVRWFYFRKSNDCHFNGWQFFILWIEIVSIHVPWFQCFFFFFLTKVARLILPKWFIWFIITPDWHFCDWERKLNFIFGMHFIVAAKCKIFFNFKKIANWENKEKFIILFVREAGAYILEWTLTELTNTLKKAFRGNLLWSFIAFFCLLHTQLSRKLSWKH